MPTPIPPDRLPRLKKALNDYSAKDMESQQKLAELYGVALSRFTTLIKSRLKDFPPAKTKGDRTNWYPARAAIQVMINYTEGKGALKRESAQRAAAVLAGEPVPATDGESPAAKNPGWPEGLMTPQELDRLASAQTRIWRLKKEQGEYVLRSEVEDMARRVFSLITQRIMNIPNIVDANGKLPPAERAALQRECREINLALYRETEGLLDHADSGNAGVESAPIGVVHHSKRRRGRKREGRMAGTT